MTLYLTDNCLKLKMQNCLEKFFKAEEDDYQGKHFSYKELVKNATALGNINSNMNVVTTFE